MKKLLLGTAALLVLGATANAADLPARTYTKAPVPIVVQNWTGFYLGGGGGYGVSSLDLTPTSLAGVQTTPGSRFGGRGAFGTVSGGYDYQFSPAWVLGVFGDAQFSDIKGDVFDTLQGVAGREKLRQSYAAGARLGYLVAPNALTYVNAGYSHASFSSANFAAFNAVPTFQTGKQERDGWFIGSGFEHNLDFFGFKAPGWTVKTEYRYAYYDSKSVGLFNIPAAAAPASLQNIKAEVQTISTQLVYKFNWGGPVVAKY